jgi:hypothetical protein
LITSRAEILLDESNEALSFGLVIFGRVNLVIVTRSLGEHGISLLAREFIRLKTSVCRHK